MLTEQVTSLALIAVFLSGLSGVLSFIQGQSSDPLVRRQALAIAEAYLEMVLATAYLDPDTQAVCPAPEADRASFDNICDYHGTVDADVRDVSGVPVPGLSAYSVQVAVQADGQAAIHDLDGLLEDGTTPRVIRVDVRVAWSGRHVLGLSAHETAPN